MTKTVTTLGAEVDWLYGEPSENRQDAIFYTGVGWIATITYEGFYMDLYCDGDTQVTMTETPNGNHTITLSDPDDFDRAGITNDTLLQHATDSGLIEWHDNSWFDFYCDGEHLDLVTHTIGEAIAAAEEYLQRQYLDEQKFMRD